MALGILLVIASVSGIIHGINKNTLLVILSVIVLIMTIEIGMFFTRTLINWVLKNILLHCIFQDSCIIYLPKSNHTSDFKSNFLIESN